MSDLLWVLTNNAHKHLKSRSTCVQQEVTMYMLSLPKFRPHGLIVLSLKYAVLSLTFEASSVDFPPQQLPQICTFILTTLSY